MQNSPLPGSENDWSFITDETAVTAWQQQLNELPLALALLNNGGKTIAFANARFAQLFSLQPTALPGKALADVVAGTAPALLPEIEDAFETGKSKRLSLQWPGANNGAQTISAEQQVFIWPLSTQNGADKKLLLILFTRQTNQFTNAGFTIDFAGLANAMPQLIWVALANGDVIYYNNRVQDFAGAILQPDGTWQWRGLLHPDDLEPTAAAWQHAVTTGSTYEIEHRAQLKNGGYRWLLSRGIPEKDGSGQVLLWYGTATDIHAVKTAEEKIKESEDRFRSAFENAAIGMALLTTSGRYVEINKAYEELVGYDIEELRGMTPLDITHPDDKAKKLQELEAAKDNKTAGGVSEKRYIRKTGEIVWVQVSATAISNPHGEPTIIVGLAKNITSEKLAIEKLARSEQQFRSLAENTPDVITKHGPDFRYLYASPLIEHYTGIKAEDFVGRSYRELGMPEELCAFFDKHLATVFATKQPLAAEYQMPNDNRNVHSRVLPELDEAGNVVAVLVLSTDVTEQKRAGEELAYQKQLLETVTENTSLALFMMDEKQCCVYMNEAAEHMTGYSLAELQGKQLHYYVHHTHPDGRPYPLEECPIDQALPTQKRMKGEEVFVHKDGHFYSVAFTASPILVDGKPTGTVIEVRDTTEEKEKERVLREITATQEETLALFESLLNNAPIGFAFFDREFRYLRINQTLADINGIPVPDHIGKTLQSLLPEQAAAVIPVIEDVFGTGRASLSIEVSGTTPAMPGKRRHWITSFYPVLTEKTGAVDFVGVVVMEITDRKQAEEQLKRSNERFELINRATQDAIWDWDLQNQKLVWNEAISTLFGYAKDAQTETIAWWQAHIHADDRENILTALDNVMRTGQDSWTAEYRFLCADTNYKTVLHRGFVLHNEQGDAVRIVGSMQDITERKENEMRFQMLANSIAQLAWIANGEGWIYWYNQRWYDYTGSNLEEMKGWGWEKVHHPKHIQRVVNFVAEAWQRGEPWELTFPLRGKTGEFRWFLTRAYPVKNNQGQVVQWIGTNTDIHDQQTLAEKLESLVADRTRELQRSNDDLQQFAHVASHDLKEPVRKIRTFGSRLMDEFGEVLPDKARHYVEKIESAASRMYSMIDGVLSYSTFEAAELTVKQPVELSQVIQQVLTDLEIMVQQKDAVITTGSLPVAEGSAVLLHQLFYNLLVNALKFTKPGVQPAIHIDAVELAPDHPLLKGLETAKNFACITVADNGIGFDEEDAAKIFKTFTRLHSKDSYEGTGLGLALCKKIAERHGGTINAAGKKGEGATFAVVLPLAGF